MLLASKQGLCRVYLIRIIRYTPGQDVLRRQAAGTELGFTDSFHTVGWLARGAIVSE